jgi:hypothetical protein
MNESTQHGDRQEAALLDVVRLALNGDHRSLRQRVRNLLRSDRAGVLSEDGRRYLQELVTAGGDLEPLRATSARRPTDPPLPAEVAPIPEAAPIPDSARDAPPPALDREAQDRVARLIREHEHRHLLEEVNLAPTSRVLLSGPPGGGKTMTARFIAHELKLPLLLAEPSQVLTGVMGESARNLSGLMRNAAARPCVLFLDELDAYARRRGESHDIAEPKRLVNTLLLELDRWPEHSLLIAATNHWDVLDPAVRRRFELTIELGHPGLPARKAIVAGVLERAGRQCPPELLDVIAGVTDGRAGSDLVNDAVAAVRRSIIDEMPLSVSLGQQFLSPRFAGRGKAESTHRVHAARQLAAHSWRPVDIARTLGVQPAQITKTLARRH